MCAIMGYTAADIPLSRLENAFSAAKSRGPDGSRSLALPGGSLLFHRLAIMGLHPEGMQPFTAPDGSAVVCNGELYGFRQMKRELEAKGYAFSSGSDCELLLPLWREYGEDIPMEQKKADAFIAPLVTLHAACEQELFPSWAEGALKELKNGSILRSLEDLL